MYHSRFKGTHFAAGLRYGEMLLKNGSFIPAVPTFKITRERREFARACLPLYEKYYPEILEEIRGLARGQKASFRDFCTFLFSMYCFEFSPRCTCLAYSKGGQVIFGRNSDFLPSMERLNMNCLYSLDGAYAFNGNTTAFVQMEDGVNGRGLAAGLTLVYPSLTAPGLNSGMLIRYILEKCSDTRQAVQRLRVLPIASQQTITLADKNGDIAVVECNCKEVCVTEKTAGFAAAANRFTSPKMQKYNNPAVDNCRSAERLSAVTQALKNRDEVTAEFVKEILAGKHGFTCQYDRTAGVDTVWSAVYDIGRKEIYRAEGNPGRRSYKKDERFKFAY